MTVTKRKPGRPAPEPPSPVDPTPADVSVPRGHREGLANLKEAAAYLGNVHVDTVRRLIAKRELPSRKVGWKVCIPWVALEAYASRTA